MYMIMRRVVWKCNCPVVIFRFCITYALYLCAADVQAAEQDAWAAQLSGVSLSSDAFFPFRDNVDQVCVCVCVRVCVDSLMGFSQYTR